MTTLATKGPLSMRTIASLSQLVIVLATFGCGDDEASSYRMTGTVNDFTTQAPIDGVATVATEGLIPPPTIEVTGSSFSIHEIPPASVFDVLAGSSGFLNTYNAAVSIDNSDLNYANMYAVPEAYPAELAATLGITRTADTGVVIARVIDNDGNIRPNVPAGQFELPAGVQGPFFFDANRNPDPALIESTSSGLFVVFDVPIGLFRITTAPGQTLAVTMSEVPVAATTLTLVDVTVGEKDKDSLPVNVSFSEDVVPIFTRRLCIACHAKKKGKGKNPAGGLDLKGGDIYTEITNPGALEGSRVNLETPEASLLLTLPSREDPPDSHPNVTFTGPDDLDYQLILIWIQEGALNN